VKKYLILILLLIFPVFIYADTYKSVTISTSISNDIYKDNINSIDVYFFNEVDGIKKIESVTLHKSNSYGTVLTNIVAGNLSFYYGIVHFTNGTTDTQGAFTVKGVFSPVYNNEVTLYITLVIDSSKLEFFDTDDETDTTYDTDEDISESDEGNNSTSTSSTTTTSTTTTEVVNITSSIQDPVIDLGESTTTTSVINDNNTNNNSEEDITTKKNNKKTSLIILIVFIISLFIFLTVYSINKRKLE